MSDSRDTLFEPASAPITPRAAIAWWEHRRLFYNAVVILAAIIALVVFYIAIVASGQLPEGEDAVEPLGLIVGVILFPFVINVCYTLGWLVEAPLRLVRPNTWPRFGSRLFALGLAFSLLVVGAPAIIWMGIWIRSAIA